MRRHGYRDDPDLRHIYGLAVNGEKFKIKQKKKEMRCVGEKPDIVGYEKQGNSPELSHSFST